MTDDVLVYIGEGATLAPAIRQALDQAQQCSGGRLYVMPSDALPHLGAAQVIRSPQDMQLIAPALSKSDTLFAAAWFLRQDKDDRPGDGKSWDAPGFKAP